MRDTMLKTIERTFLQAVLLLALAGAAAAQDRTSSEQARAGLSGARLDSTLLGKNIFSVLPSRDRGGRADVKVRQSQAVAGALAAQVAANSSKTITGYRVRIFNDNKQTARGDSEAAMDRFTSLYPGIPAYRTFTSPFFKVTVGDFRTKSEASRLLLQLVAAYPSAFVVKETINYPIQYDGRGPAAPERWDQPEGRQ